jgi:two-component system, chemotaxis family, chemotaxis protein CheY
MSKTVMIVDDSATVLMLLKEILSNAGLETAAAGSAEEALAAIKNGVKPDLIITDLNMGALNGIQLVREVRRIPCYRFTPIVLLSTERQQAKRLEAKSAGATGWIVKPFKTEALLQAVKQLLPAAFTEDDLFSQDFSGF